MVKVADLWWDLAQKAALTKPRILVRSEFWYRLTLPIAEGIVKTRIEKRLEVIDSTKIDPAGLAVSEATRKILPTAADLDRLKLLAAGAQTNTEKHQEMSKMLAEFDEHLRADLYGPPRSNCRSFRPPSIQSTFRSRFSAWALPSLSPHFSSAVLR
jgi:hypothetical protein